MIKIARLLLWVIIISAIAAGAYYMINRSKEPFHISRGHVNDIETMTRLCAIDIYNEAPVLDTINNKVIFAVQKQSGSISFDLQNIHTENSGDTLFVTLPKEIVEIKESTEPDSWQIIDTKSLALFIKDRMSLNEENAVKSKLRGRAIRQLYENGTVARARAEAATNLRSFLENIYRHPVIVIDPTPNGTLSH